MPKNPDQSGRRPLILHIASDYSDGLEGKGKAATGAAHRQRRPTLAINRLVEGAEDFDHVVFSLHRMSLPIGMCLKDLGTPQRANVRVFAYAHYGFPLGIGLFHSFWVVARTVRRVLQKEGLRPDAVHAHRLTFDGIGGWLLARALDIPLFISIRGEVERKVFKFKPTYRPLMRKIVARASGIFYVSAWYAPALEKYTGVSPGRTHLLPNILDEHSPSRKPRPVPTSFLTVANLNIWRKKGLGGLLPAFANALTRLPSLRLSIVGGGTPQAVAQVRALIERLGMQDHVNLEGALPSSAVRARMREAMALVLPSHNETFGVVFLEALYAGVPILYSKGTGIDGFLNGLPVGIAVDPASTRDITRALIELAEQNARYREAVVASADDLTKRFGRENVLRQYQRTLWAGMTLERVPSLAPQT